MSYILDALKKSDQQRQQQRAPDIHSRPKAATPTRKTSVPIWIPVILVLVIFNILLWPNTPTDAEAVEQVSTLPEPIKLSPSSVDISADSHNELHYPVESTPLGSNMDQVIQGSVPDPSQSIVQATIPAKPSYKRDPFVPLTPMPKASNPVAKVQAVHKTTAQPSTNLARLKPNLPTPDMLKLQQTLVRQQIMSSLPTIQTQHPDIKVAKPVAPTAVTPKPIPVNTSAMPDQTQRPAADVWAQAAQRSPIKSKPPKPAPSLPVSEQAGAIPYQMQLPDEVLQDLPEITVSVHIFDHEPSRRKARINGQMVYQGDSLEQGLSLEEITPQALIFKYKEHLFRVAP